MYRTGSHLCPVCGDIFGRETVFSPHVRGQVELDRCRSCGTAYFAFNDGEPSGLARALGVSHSTVATQDDFGEERPLCCPECRVAMELRLYLDGPWVFRCGSCLGTLALPDQLEALRRFSLLPEGTPREPPKAIMSWWETLCTLLF